MKNGTAAGSSLIVKPWKTDAWKKKRDELIKDRVCEWCGSET